jgi:hypothetical protein
MRVSRPEGLRYFFGNLRNASGVKGWRVNRAEWIAPLK